MFTVGPTIAPVKFATIDHLVGNSKHIGRNFKATRSGHGEPKYLNFLRGTWSATLEAMRPERHLAAIVAADVAGYSRLMGVDEEGTLAQLKAHRHALLDPKISGHRGRIVKTTGDGMLVEFASVVDALRCAIDIQRGMAERNDGIPQEKRIEFRLGINVGDVIIDGGDIFGDGVNVAARLEGLAEPGGICVSGRVQEDARGKLDIGFEDIGEQQLKNIERPVRVYRVLVGGGGAATGTSALAIPDKPSIAVLPFQNMSGDPEQDYFCDGMVEDIITGLSRIKWLFVIARNSSFSYKGKAVAVKEVAEKLGVRYVLEGSVRKSGNRVRISAQLIEGATGSHLWAEKYDRMMEDVFVTQDEITMCVVGAMEPNLRRAEVDRVTRQRTNNLNAYDLVLRSLPFVYAQMPKEIAIAIPMLEDALKLDPGYADAHAFLSWCLHARFARGGLLQKDRIAAINHAREAVARSNDDATTLAIAAFVIAQDERDTATALTLFDRALELSNCSLFALSFSAITLALMGRAELAIQRAQLALRLNPLDSSNFWPYHALAIAYFGTERYEDAIEAARRVIDSSPNFSLARVVVTAALIRLGRAEEAKGAAQAVLEYQPSFTIRGLALFGSVEPTAFGRVVDALREAGLPE